MTLPSTKLRLPHLDRLSIWPTETGYGLDVTWTGPDGLRDADRLKEELQRLGLQTRLIQELGGLTTRVEPMTGEETRQVVAFFVRQTRLRPAAAPARASA